MLRLQNEPVGETENRTVGVLLLHGLTGAPSELKPVSQRLRSQGFRVETPVLAGHGGDHKQLLKTTWRDWLQSARQALLHLQAECEQVFVSGLSMSTLLAVHLATESPVAGIILCSPTYGFLHRRLHPLQQLLPLACKVPYLHDKLYWTERPPYGLRDERLQKLISRAILAAKKGKTDKFGLFRTYIGSIEQVNQLVRQTRLIASQAQCPALILHSLEDTIAPTENATSLFTDLGSRDKQLKFIQGCDHVMTVDLQREYVAQCFIDFMARVAHKRPEQLPDRTGRQGIA